MSHQQFQQGFEEGVRAKVSSGAGGVGFQVSGCGFRVSGLGFRVSLCFEDGVGAKVKLASSVCNQTSISNIQP